MITHRGIVPTKQSRLGLFALAAIALTLLLPALPRPAFARSLVIDHFDVEVNVNTDGSILVTETIKPHFTGTWNGIYRTIPVDYRTPQGFNYRLLLKGISVTDGDGHPLKTDQSRERHYQKLKIWVPDARDAVRTVVLRYRVMNGLRFFEDHDELYWNVTGDEWEVPIDAASAHIVLPDGATGLRSLAFTGSYGSRAHEADVQTAGHVIDISMQRPLAFHEGLTVVIGWDKGVVAPPGTWDNVSAFLQSNLPLFIPVLVFPFMLWLWSTRGRDPRLRPIAVQYEPPEGLTAAEVGTLIDNSPDMRDITASIVDLAVRGYIWIEEGKDTGLFGLHGGKEYSFHMEKGPTEWASLTTHEQALLAALFDGGVQPFVDLTSMRNQFYRYLPSIRDQIFDRLMQRKYYLQRPDRVKAVYVVAGGIIGFLIFGIGMKLADSWGVAPAAAGIAGILTGIIIAGFGLIMPARTAAGARALEGILGFEDFLKRVEKDKIERIERTPAMFEKFLPYAMALGVEAHWANAFKGICNQPPSWYRGASPMGMFYPMMFVSSLGNMTQRAATVMTSAPRSARGSGFGGGGMGGGGFGGGGGGGF